MEDGAVDLTLHRFRGLFAEVTEDAVVEDDVPGCTRLDGIISRFTTISSHITATSVKINPIFFFFATLYLNPQ